MIRRSFHTSDELRAIIDANDPLFDRFDGRPAGAHSAQMNCLCVVCALRRPHWLWYAAPHLAHVTCTPYSTSPHLAHSFCSTFTGMNGGEDEARSGHAS